MEEVSVSIFEKIEKGDFPPNIGDTKISATSDWDVYKTLLLWICTNQRRSTRMQLYWCFRFGLMKKGGVCIKQPYYWSRESGRTGLKWHGISTCVCSWAGGDLVNCSWKRGRCFWGYQGKRGSFFHEVEHTLKLIGCLRSESCILFRCTEYCLVKV